MKCSINWRSNIYVRAGKYAGTDSHSYEPRVGVTVHRAVLSIQEISMNERVDNYLRWGMVISILVVPPFLVRNFVDAAPVIRIIAYV
jgi:hypothetical protein